MLQERGSCHSHSRVVTSAGGVPRAGLCLAQHGLCGETGCEDSQNPSRNSSCRNSIPEKAPAVPGRGGVLQSVLLHLLECCQCRGQPKSLQPLLWVLPSMGQRGDAALQGCSIVGASIMEAGTRSRSVTEAGNPFRSLGQLAQRAPSLLPSACSWVPQVPASFPEPSSKARH